MLSKNSLLACKKKKKNPEEAGFFGELSERADAAPAWSPDPCEWHDNTSFVKRRTENVSSPHAAICILLGTQQDGLQIAIVTHRLSANPRPTYQRARRRDAPNTGWW